VDTTGLVTWITGLVLVPAALFIAFVCFKFFVESRAAAIIGALVIGVAVLMFIIDPEILVDLGRTAGRTFRGGS